MLKETASGWKELQRAQQASCPKLFYNLKLNEDAFTLHLTDLVAIWQCSSSKADIIANARNQHTSIDPSESISQLQVLLHKLSQGLRSNRNLLQHDQDEEKQVVHLTTEIELPKPLKPLVWTFELQPQPACELAEHLLRPCLFEASVSQQKIESLQRVIKDKDHVLSRLLEKIESSSTDLSLIFPGITGFRPKRGRLTVADAEKHIKGMRKFDPGEWLTYFTTDNPYAGYDQKGINNLVIGCEKCPKHTAEEHADWLNSLPKQDDSLKGVSAELVKASFSSANTDADEDDETASEDDFETRATPPSARKRNRTGEPRGDVSEASDSDNDNPRSMKGANRRRLGGLAKNKKSTSLHVSATSSLSPQSKPSHSSKRSSSPLGIEKRSNTSLHLFSGKKNIPSSPPSILSSTESEAEDDLDKLPRKTIPRSQTMDKDQERYLSSDGSVQTGLGRVRNLKHSKGKGKDTQVTNIKSTQKAKITSPSPPPDSKTFTPSRRLGKLGKRGRDEHSSPVSSPPYPERNSDSKRGANSSALASLSGNKLSASLKPTKHKNGTATSEITDDDTDDEDLDTTQTKHIKQDNTKDHLSKTTSSTFKEETRDSATISRKSQSPSATPSPSSSLQSQDPKPTQARNTTTSSPTKPPTNRPPSSSPVRPPPPTLKRTETAEEKANRRRDELKRKTETAGGGGIAGGGVRKKRKF